MIPGRQRQDQSAENLAKRREIPARIESLRNEEGAVLPDLQAVLEGKEAKQVAAKAALEGAAEEVRAAVVALRSKRLVFRGAIENCEAELIESADPRIDEAIQFFMGKMDWLRSPGRISSNRLSSERNIFTMTKTTHAESNVDAVRGALLYCQDAIKELGNMKLHPELDMAKIEEMKAGVPDIGIYTESTGEKPLPKPPPDFQTTHGHILAKIDALKKKVGIDL